MQGPRRAGQPNPARRRAPYSAPVGERNTDSPLAKWGRSGSGVRAIPVPDGGEHVDAPIPRRLIQTWHSPASALPPRVIRTARAFSPGFVHTYFSDATCVKFLEKNYGPRYVQRFLELRSGAHKADLFRYCYLYKNGGVYMDIDLEPKVDIAKVMEGVPPGTIVTCLEPRRTGIFQAFLAAPPGHPIFKTLISEFFSHRVGTSGPRFYGYFTRHMAHSTGRMEGLSSPLRAPTAAGRQPLVLVPGAGGAWLAGQPAPALHHERATSHLQIPV